MYDTHSRALAQHIHTHIQVQEEHLELARDAGDERPKMQFVKVSSRNKKATMSGEHKSTHSQVYEKTERKRQAGRQGERERRRATDDIAPGAMCIEY